MSTVVLIPGMMCDARMWGGFQPGNSKKTLHASPTKGETITAMAAAILAQAPKRFALAGLSMGGIVAMEMLRQAPHRIERLALLDTNPYAEAEAARSRREAQIARALSGDLEGVMRDEMKPLYLASEAEGGSGRRREILDLCMEMALSLGAEVFARQSRALAGRADAQDVLAEFRRPALVLMGACDRLCPRERHERMHQLMPQSNFIVIDGAGHLPTLEQPAAAFSALEAWLSA